MSGSSGAAFITQVMASFSRKQGMATPAPHRYSDGRTSEMPGKRLRGGVLLGKKAEILLYLYPYKYQKYYLFSSLMGVWVGVVDKILLDAERILKFIFVREGIFWLMQTHQRARERERE